MKNNSADDDYFYVFVDSMADMLPIVIVGVPSAPESVSADVGSRDSMTVTWRKPA